MTSMWVPCMLVILAALSEVQAASLLAVRAHGSSRLDTEDVATEAGAALRSWPHSVKSERRGRGAFGSSVRRSSDKEEPDTQPAAASATAAATPTTTQTPATTTAVVQQLFPSAEDAAPRATAKSSWDGLTAYSMRLPVLPALVNWRLPELFGSLRAAGAAMASAMVVVTLFCYCLIRIADGPRRKAGRGQVISLDAMRVLFVTYIIVVHQKSLCGPLLQEILVGHWPMQFFTVLMGFVNFRAHSGYEQLSMAEASASLAQRLGRLCPIYFAALGWLFVLATLGRAADRPFLAWPLQALFAQSLLPLEVGGPGQPAPSWPGANYIQYGGNYVGWFAALAIFCSAMFPVLYNRRPRGGLHMVVLALGFVLALRSLPLLFAGDLPVLGQGPDLHVFALLRLLEYYAGILFAQLSDELPETAREWCGWSVVSDMSLVIVLVSVACWTHAIGVDGPPGGDYLLTGLFGLHAMASALSQKTKQQGSIDKLLAFSGLAHFAPYSYGAFVLQVPIRYSLPATLFWSHPQIMVAVHVVSTWAVGFVATLLLERPCARIVASSLARNDADALATPMKTPRLP